MPVTVYVKSSVKLPRLPNFLILDDDAGKIPVEALSDESLGQIGEMWTEALIEHARRRREEPDTLSEGEGDG